MGYKVWDVSVGARSICSVRASTQQVCHKIASLFSADLPATAAGTLSALSWNAILPPSTAARSTRP